MVIVFILFLVLNPFSYNEGGNRTVVQRAGGEQIVQFQSGMFYSGFFSKETEWPNQISVTYQSNTPNLDLEDNGIEIGHINIMFSDGTRADVKGITQFILPADEKDMILMHNTHRTPSSLVTKRLSTFTKECLQSSAQLMTSDKHYGGGRAQMSQDFLDQLKEGVYLSQTEERIVYDSVEKEKKRLYLTVIQVDPKTKLPRRKMSAIKEYGITVADGSIVDVDYEDKVDKKLEKIIDATTKSAISRQDLMTAQQQTLTEKAKGEQALVEIEYKSKQEQTKQVVEAQTRVQVAQQNKLEQQASYEANLIAVKSRQALADVTAYEKRTVMSADGALEKKLAAYIEVQKYWAAAFGAYQGNIVPQWQSGGGNGNGAINFMEIMGAKASKDLMLDLKNKN